MRNIFKIWLVLVVSVSAFYPIYKAQADNDYMEARKLLEEGEILPLESILAQIKSMYPGKLLEVELERKNGSIFYEIEILTKNGIVKEIYVNAKTGNLESVKEDD